MRVAVRRVEMERGRAGFGFTLWGQAPCVLRGIIRGSPAHSVGLRAGDRILRVNDSDASRSSHEAVVRLISTCSHSLSLLVTSGPGEEDLTRPSRDTTPDLSPGHTEPALQAGGSCHTLFEITDEGSATQQKPRPLSEPDAPPTHSHAPPDLALIVGYIDSADLELRAWQGAQEGVGAVRRCIRGVSVRQKTHSLVLMRVTGDGVRLCDERGGELLWCPAQSLALCVPCTEDSRFFGLVTAAAEGAGQGVVRAECHVFFIDPELFLHSEHLSIIALFSLSCTARPDTPGCLEFPQTPQPLAHFLPRLYRGAAEYVERLRMELDGESPEESDSGIERDSLISPDPPPYSAQPRGHAHPERRCLLSEPLRPRWQRSRPSSAECLLDSALLPPPMEQIPTLRYKPLEERSCASSRLKEPEHKGSLLWALARGRSSVRRPAAPAKRLSLAHSLNDLETATSDGGVCERQDSVVSLVSEGSVPVFSGRRVASWAVSLERLLRDPEGVRYFSEFLKKEFSEENILFWQECETFSRIPELNKKKLSQKAKEIYSRFLSSKASMPVNIDSQAQLADDVLTAPQPDMFRQPQLQIFNLMKMDSYARFLKSALYQECVLADVEGRALPDPRPIPCSPAPSKHSFTSDRASFSSSSSSSNKKESSRPRPGRSSDDLRHKKSGFFSWSRYPSLGKGPKKRGAPELPYSYNGRRESLGSLSSGASQELITSCSSGKHECELACVEKERWSGTCTVTLPDGSSRCVCVGAGVSVRQVLLEILQEQHISLAAVDLFLSGGEKPLVLDQDSATLSSRNLRIEKRTLFRLDLVPINRSVGLKAKPTKPVTEVLRPVVAKYGLQLSDLTARISGDAEALDLGLPISNLDGLRVVLDTTDQCKPLNAKVASKKVAARERNLKAAEDKPPRSERKKGKKSQKDESDELFELLSRAQSSRVEDQRGLLRKEDLVLPDFLRLHPASSPAPPDTPPLSPISAQGEEQEEGLAELTLVGEDDINSPNSTLLPPPPSSPPPYDDSLPLANFTPPPCLLTDADAEEATCTSVSAQQGDATPSSDTPPPSPAPAVMEDSFEGYAAELRQCQSRMRTGSVPVPEPAEPEQYKATFV